MIAPSDITLFTDFFRTVDQVLADVGGNAAAGLSRYIVPIAWTALGVLMLVWASAIYFGSGNSVKEWFQKSFAVVLIIQFASTFYGPWVATPLMGIPDELSAAVARATSTSAPDQLVASLEQLVLGVMGAGVEAFKNWNIGGAVTLFSASILMIIAGVLLLVSVVFNMLYAKIGMAYVLAIGPLFIFFLSIPTTRGWFQSWLNTAFYFVVLSLLSTLTMLLFTGVANAFMQKLAAAIQTSSDARTSLYESMFNLLVGSMTGEGGTAAAAAGDAAGNALGANFNVISISLQMVLLFIPMFLVALETRTLVGSLTGGSGGSFGSGVANVVSTMWRGGWGRHSGGTTGAEVKK